MAFTTLISTAVLAARLDDPAFVIVDCRFKLDDTAWGDREFRAAHVPGASYVHLDRNLSGPKTGTNGRHPLPEVATVAATFGRLGITSGVQVVAYDQDSGMFASRLWWILRWLGHDTVAVLDGGFARWIAEGRPTVAGPATARAERMFGARPRTDMLVDVSSVAAMATQPGWRLVDARAPERFRGEVEPLDKQPGHIPGATNHFFAENVDPQSGTFRTPSELRAAFQPALGGVEPDRVVCYCGSGVTACHNLLALEHAGIRGAKLYAGSWSEWSADPERPVERG